MSPLGWGLLASVFVALVIMTVAFFYTRRRVKFMRQDIAKEMVESEIASNDKAVSSPSWGKLDYDLKKQSVKPLGDEPMLLAINTALRNSFKTVKVFNASDAYEEKTLAKFANVHVANDSYDLALIKGNSESASLIGSVYDKLAPRGLIIVTDIKRGSNDYKVLMSDLKFLRYRHEFQAIGDGVVIIAK